MSKTEEVPVYAQSGASDIPSTMKLMWEDGEDFKKALIRNRFAHQFRIGRDPRESYFTIEMYTRDAHPQCLLDIGDVNGFVYIAAWDLQTGLDLCARWAPIVTAAAVSSWPEDLADFMLNNMPSQRDIEQSQEERRAAYRRSRMEAAQRRAQKGDSHGA